MCNSAHHFFLAPPPLSLSPSSIAPLRSSLSTIAEMAKDKTRALERVKKTTTKEKKTAKGSTSRSALLPCWIQGDWIPSSVSEEDLEGLAADDLIAPGSWRMPEGEFEPAPRDGERVLLKTHVERGFLCLRIQSFTDS